jgi:hypothetical protein
MPELEVRDRERLVDRGVDGDGEDHRAAWAREGNERR